MATGDDLLEAVTADSIAHEGARAAKHSLPIGAPCPNCHTAVAGPWCYACGQRAEKYNRSIWRLTLEAAEGLTDLDGRLWKTLPRLVVRPGTLTREYLDGHRAAQVPPFRIFLIVVLLVFFTGGLDLRANSTNFKLAALDSPEIQKSLSPSDRADFQQAIDAMRVEFAKPAPTATRAGKWLRAQMIKALGNPEAFKAAVAEWAERLAILMLPIAAVMLSVLFVFKKGVYVFDHLIFSMHSLAFQGLLLSVVFGLGVVVDGGAWLLLLSPVHLFVHMRGTYKISWFGTLIRMFLLFIGSSWAFGFLILGLLLVGLATVH
ncbi:DUF3667 domain-containing protein [Phenylobacterium sp.]|jgi:hypothetical protein|uniref:DUF3667 domain-containing protein n=1 Tax=Phenylobacterium sp. TaxID=1871053 RepID=UPI002E37F450|nr:DUF3667 domain-containing protein [Phenylobacterium sp.]HEX3366856.1 DUF3667 domain-containing protein [Phenylobacterium sp.]